MIAGVLGLLFVGINLYFIKNDLELIDRTSIVHDQKQAQTEDLQEILYKNGVIQTANEQYVYFSEQLGMFTQFLVEEGQIVTAGTPLYEYTVLDLEEQRLLFESEAEQLRSEIASIQAYITELNSIEGQLSSAATNQSTANANTNPTNSLDDEELLVTIELEVGIDVSDATVDQTRAQINQKIGEQEAAIGRLEAEAGKYDQLIAGLEESPVVTVESDFNGKIAQLEESLENPLITVYSDNLTSRSLLSDEEALIVIAGLGARVTSPVANDTLNGSVVANPQLPKDEPVLGEKSLYEIDVDLQDQNSDWFIGQHVVNELITDESIGATTVPIISLDEQRIYALSPTGLVEPRLVELGLRVEDRQEVFTNLEAGEWIAVDPEQIERFYSPYITPMTIERLTFDNLGQLDTRASWKHVLLGVLPH